MVIVHLSDLHLESEDDYLLLAYAETAIKKIKPSTIIVSGDLVSHPRAKKLQKAKEALESIKENSGSKHFIVVPGNHDRKLSGLFGYTMSCFDKCFPDWKKSHHIENPEGRDVFIFPVDSNPNLLLNLARGSVSERELKRFVDEFNSYAKNPAFKNGFKIAVLHHHPLPIASSETGAITDSDAFLGMSNAGVVLRAMISKGVDLILHGHKHHPFSAKIRMSLNSGDLAIIAAGSACKTNGPPPSFNVIRIEEQLVELSVWTKSNGTEFHPSLTIPIFDYSTFRESLYEAFCSDISFPFAIKHEIHQCKIKKTGDAAISINRTHRQLHPLMSEIDKIPLVLKSAHSTYADYSVTSSNTVPVNFRKEEQRNGILRGMLEYGVHAASMADNFSYRQTFNIINGFSRYREERIRIKGDDKKEFFVATPRCPTDRLSIELKFEGKMRALNPEVIVLVVDSPENADTEKRNANEENHCRAFLQVSEDGKLINFQIPKPLKGHRYGICWDSPPKEPTKLPPDIVASAAELRNILLSLDTQDLTSNPLQDVFKQIQQEVSSKCSRRKDETLCCGLMVYDPNLVRLRYVAGIFPRQYWAYRLHDGQGIAGRSHKIGEPISYFQARAKTDFSSDPPPEVARPSVLMCHPVVYPTRKSGAEEIIGVMTIWSVHPNSCLLQAYSNPAISKIIENMTKNFVVSLIKSSQLPLDPNA